MIGEALARVVVAVAVVAAAGWGYARWFFDRGGECDD